jgi:hypothetical protein
LHIEQLSLIAAAETASLLAEDGLLKLLVLWGEGVVGWGGPGLKAALTATLKQHEISASSPGPRDS